MEQGWDGDSLEEGGWEGGERGCDRGEEGLCGGGEQEEVEGGCKGGEGVCREG